MVQRPFTAAESHWQAEEVLRAGMREKGACVFD